MSDYSVVIGTDHVNTLGIVRSLGEAKLDFFVIVVSEKQYSWVMSSKYVKDGVICKRDDKSLLKALQDVSAHRGSTRIRLIPAGDDFVSFCEKNKAELIRIGFILPGIGNSSCSLAEIMSKYNMSEYAHIAGFSIPNTTIVELSDEFCKDIIISHFNMQWPLIIRSDNQAAPSCEFALLNSIEDLEIYLLKNRTGKAIVQEYIKKDEEMGICGVGLGIGKEVCIPAVIHKHRTSVVSSGSTTYASICVTKGGELVEKAKKFISMLGYSGIFDIEIMRRGEEYFFVECNFRNGAYGYAYTSVGFNLPMIWVTGQLKNAENEHLNKTLMNEFSDYRNISSHKVSTIQWIAEFFRADIYLTLNRKDMKPFYARLFHAALK